MSLIDVYLYYNRLRGSEVLTTNELQTVMNELNRLQLQVEMRKLPDGLRIIQLRTYNFTPYTNPFLDRTQKPISRKSEK